MFFWCYPAFDLSLTGQLLGEAFWFDGLTSHLTIFQMEKVPPLAYRAQKSELLFVLFFVFLLFVWGFFVFVFCSTSQQRARVPLGRIFSDKSTCCHTEKEVADQTCHLIQSQYTDTRPTSPNADRISPGVQQGSHRRTNLNSMTRPGIIPTAKARIKPKSSPLGADALSTRPTRQ